ncbi:hypothetical protein ABT034_21060 [Streptomyces sp. NPDC002773]|uniref:hypothetical protein n=1 Tax=Streptomyces sp. NPDC002773 TaxID=3154430 RepID=UPI00332FD749
MTTTPSPDRNPDATPTPTLDETAPEAPTPAPEATAPTAPAPYTFGLRVAAAFGLLFLVACLVLTAIFTLGDAIDGDGVGGVFITAGFWSLALGAAAGVAALVVPRRALVTAQYCLGLAGPLLALMD